jgi:hypothetical protein
MIGPRKSFATNLSNFVSNRPLQAKKVRKAFRERSRSVVSYRMMTKAQRAIVDAGKLPGIPVPTDLSGNDLALFFQKLAENAAGRRRD